MEKNPLAIISNPLEKTQGLDTITFSKSDLEKYLPTSLKKDEWGNYYTSIGDSQTLFTCHLDNYCKEKVKVNHVICSIFANL